MLRIFKPNFHLKRVVSLTAFICLVSPIYIASPLCQAKDFWFASVDSRSSVTTQPQQNQQQNQQQRFQQFAPDQVDSSITPSSALFRFSQLPPNFEPQLSADPAYKLQKDDPKAKLPEPLVPKTMESSKTIIQQLVASDQQARNDRYKNTIPSIFRLTLKGYSIIEYSDRKKQTWTLNKVDHKPFRKPEIMFSWTKEFH